ncbi:unnamed protein product [Bursaphelenchus xylophilus]|nr:unnamed protein product [Bursaphelenchus xylophilus]CAG9124659.1 unnamed protein product [Bursaphelenchus xylophilus]
MASLVRLILLLSLISLQISALLPIHKADMRLMRVQKRFYNWEASHPEKRFYSWDSTQPQISAKERDFVKQFLQRRGGADWLRQHKMFSQFTNVDFLQ